MTKEEFKEQVTKWTNDEYTNEVYAEFIFKEIKRGTNVLTKNPKDAREDLMGRVYTGFHSNGHLIYNSLGDDEVLCIKKVSIINGVLTLIANGIEGFYRYDFNVSTIEKEMT